MKNFLLLTAVPVLLVPWGFGQAPSNKTTTTATTTEQASIQGCLGGSAGNYTVTQDGTPQTFKITTSAVNLKPHLGHDVELTGKRVSAPGFGVTDSTLAVTAVKMIADHCATAAAAASTVADPTAATVPSPAAAVSANGSAGTPAAADPVTATVATPPATTPTPATTDSAPAATDPATATVTTATVTTPAAASTPAPPDSVPPAAAATTTTSAVAAKAPADPASTPVMASDSAPLPNTPAPSAKATKVTGKLGADGKTFVSDSDSKSWTVTNPDAVKGHEGHHVVLTAHVDADTSQVNVVSLKMAK